MSAPSVRPSPFPCGPEAVSKVVAAAQTWGLRLAGWLIAGRLTASKQVEEQWRGRREPSAAAEIRFGSGEGQLGPGRVGQRAMAACS